MPRFCLNLILKYWERYAEVWRLNLQFCFVEKEVYKPTLLYHLISNHYSFSFESTTNSSKTRFVCLSSFCIYSEFKITMNF